MLICYANTKHCIWLLCLTSSWCSNVLRADVNLVYALNHFWTTYNICKIVLFPERDVCNQSKPIKRLNTKTRIPHASILWTKPFNVEETQRKSLQRTWRMSIVVRFQNAKERLDRTQSKEHGPCSSWQSSLELHVTEDSANKLPQPTMDIGELNVRCLQGIGDVIQGRLGAGWIPKTLDHRLKVLELDHGGATQAQDTHNFSIHCGIIFRAKLR